MALITSAASGNFNATATWTGGVVPGVGDTARAATGHTITITANVACDAVTNTATGNGRFVLNDGVTLTANISPVTISSGNSQNFVEFNSASPAQCYVVGDVVGFPHNAAFHSIANNSSGTVNVTGNVTGSSVGSGQNTAIANIAGGIVNVTGNVTGTAAIAIRNSNVGTIIVTGNVEGGTTSTGILNSTTGIIQVVGSFIASSASSAISSANAFVRASGSFIYAANGRAPVSASGLLLWSTPSNSMTRYALNGLGSFVDMFTADNALGQANPSDVRSGVSYASGSLTGTLAVPVRGTISYGVTYGPAMPFTATRSGTTATATLAYSHPYQVGDAFTVSGAFYSDWNGDYTVASVVSGTSITFSVPDTFPASTGAGAVLQTKGTAVLDGASVASAVWSAAARTITGGVVDTLTTAPTVPTPSQIASQVRTELSTELSRLDVATSTRAVAADIPTSDISAIKAKTDNLPASPAAVSDIPTTAQISAAVEGSLLNEGDGQAVLNAIVGAIGNQNLSEVSLVAAIRSDLERVGGKIDSIPTDSAPSAASVATAVWSASTKEITGGVVDTLTNSPDVPTEAEIATAVWGASTKEITGGTVTNLTNAPASVTPADIWDYNDRTLTSASGPTAVEIRQEIDANSTKLDVAVGTRLAASAYTAPANSDVAAIKTKTDAINVDRINNTATTAIVGNLLAQANS